MKLALLHLRYELKNYLARCWVESMAQTRSFDHIEEVLAEMEKPLQVQNGFWMSVKGDCYYVVFRAQCHLKIISEKETEMMIKDIR